MYCTPMPSVNAFIVEKLSETVLGFIVDLRMLEIFGLLIRRRQVVKRFYVMYAIFVVWVWNHEHLILRVFEQLSA